MITSIPDPMKSNEIQWNESGLCHSKWVWGNFLTLVKFFFRRKPTSKFGASIYPTNRKAKRSETNETIQMRIRKAMSKSGTDVNIGKISSLKTLWKTWIVTLVMNKHANIFCRQLAKKLAENSDHNIWLQVLQFETEVQNVKKTQWRKLKLLKKFLKKFPPPPDSPGASPTTSEFTTTTTPAL
jgi:hypothetical protein